MCLSEPDPIRLKRSLGIIYKSGDLLLHLLNDLLTFSKNEVGQHLSLDEKEFRLRDIQTQTLAIFEKQAKEGDIKLKVEFEGVHNALDPERRQYNGPADTGRMRDMILWGDVYVHPGMQYSCLGMQHCSIQIHTREETLLTKFL